MYVLFILGILTLPVRLIGWLVGLLFFVACLGFRAGFSYIDRTYYTLLSKNVANAMQEQLTNIDLIDEEENNE